MRALLDTHALIWALEDSPKLSDIARDVIEDSRNAILVSTASAIEIAIKKALGKLTAPDDLTGVIEQVGFTGCPLSFDVAEQLARLPSHHRDPFDRLLIAHALREGVPIISCDEQMHRYTIQVIW